MFGQILATILNQPKVVQPNQVQEKTDYSLVIAGSVALIVVTIVIFLLLKKGK